MYRLAGILVGSGLAVALILMVLGVPELPGATEPPTVAMPQPVSETPASTRERDHEAVSRPDPDPALATVAPDPASPPVEPAAQPAPARWHTFWSPFGSRIAANGFVSRLEAVTGFDYRVVKVENGVFEVAFAYTSDAERDQMLSAIATATGLELPDS